MSKERCQAVKQLMKQALSIMDIDKKACGDGKGLRLALTYLEDSYLRMDFHMREMGWLDSQVAANPMPKPSVPDYQLPIPDLNKPRINTLRPAAAIPQLATGLMNPTTAAPDPTAPPRTVQRRDIDDVIDDISLLP